LRYLPMENGGLHWKRTGSIYRYHRYTTLWWWTATGICMQIMWGCPRWTLKLKLQTKLLHIKRHLNSSPMKTKDYWGCIAICWWSSWCYLVTTWRATYSLGRLLIATTPLISSFWYHSTSNSLRSSWSGCTFGSILQTVMAMLVATF
jgi:hypothetical protein